MDTRTKILMDGINRAIIKFRGVYSAWSKKHGISYNEMLVLYTIRDEGFCTQKQICDSYLLPRQTMNHVFFKMCESELLEVSSEFGPGREKAFILTEKGQDYARPFIDSLSRVEERAAELMGSDKIRAMTELVREYDRCLAAALGENDQVV